MLRFCSFVLVLITLAFSNSSFGQEVDEKLKLKQEQDIKLLEEVLADADNLRLPENRALIYAKVGNKIWQIDEKKARELFDNAIDDLIKAQNEANSNTNNIQNVQNLIYGQFPRRDILNLIAVHDAQLALDALLLTRPSKLLKAIAKHKQNQTSENTSFNSRFRYSNNANYAYSEIESEQRFIAMAAEQNPKRMEELFHKGLKKGVNYNTIRLLQKIHSKDAKLSSKLLEVAVKELLRQKITDNKNNVSSFTSFLDNFGNTTNIDDKYLVMSVASARNIADKVSAFWINPDTTTRTNTNSRTFKLIEKLFPARAKSLKLRYAKNKQLQKQNAERKRFEALMKTKPSGTELLKQAKTFSNYRNSIYSSAINKLTEEGNISEVLEVVKSQFPEDQANRRLAQIYTNLANKEVSNGNFESAISYINEIPNEKSRFIPLINIANSIFYKNRQENKDYALSILQQLVSMIDSQPQTSNDIRMIIYLANSYSNIEPSQSFRLIDSIVEPLNTYSKAISITSQFNNNGSVRNGEMLISRVTVGNGGFNLTNILLTLKKTDFQRTIELINRFEQNEVRIALKLTLVSDLNDQMTRLSVSSSRSLITLNE